MVKKVKPRSHLYLYVKTRQDKMSTPVTLMLCSHCYACNRPPTSTLKVSEHSGYPTCDEHKEKGVVDAAAYKKKSEEAFDIMYPALQLIVNALLDPVSIRYGPNDIKTGWRVNDRFVNDPFVKMDKDSWAISMMCVQPYSLETRPVLLKSFLEPELIPHGLTSEIIENAIAYLNKL